MTRAPVLLNLHPKARDCISYWGRRVKTLGKPSEQREEEEEEGGTLTAWGLIVLVIWEEIVQSLFTGV